MCKIMKSLLIGLFLSISLISISILSSVKAQIGLNPLSGNNPESYICEDGTEASAMEKRIDGYFYCANGKRALLRPPALQQIEVLFKRVVYVVWAVVASFSFILLVYLGYRYMLRGGTTDEELVKLRKGILNYAFGFALVFLAIPILTTIFNLLNINTSVSCYDVNMPGFQFFFSELCVDTIGEFNRPPRELLQTLIEKYTSEGKTLNEANLLAIAEINGKVCDPARFPSVNEERIPLGLSCIIFSGRCDPQTRTWSITSTVTITSCPR